MLTLKRMLVLVIALVVSNAHAQRTAAPNLGTDTRSTVFTTAEERVEFLDRYLNFPTRPKDVKYHLVYHDNSQGFPPGPSDWDMRIVVWLEPADVPLWLKDVQEVVAEPFEWVLELSSELDEQVLAEARYFEASGKRAALLGRGVLALWYNTF